jgi:hypothetical protein
LNRTVVVLPPATLATTGEPVAEYATTAGASATFIWNAGTGAP